MSKLVWGATGNRYYETGTDRGVLYVDDNDGVPWNGLISVNETTSGGEQLSYYLDGYKYLNLLSAEEFSATITAFSAPREFAECDGTKTIAYGLFVSQQPRKKFAFSYRTLVGNDEDALDHGYKLHLVYGALASPADKTNQTLADSVSPMNISWGITTVAPRVPGIRPTAHFVVDTRFTPRFLIHQLEDILYGTDGTSPRIPDVDELISIFSQEPTVITRNIAYTIDYDVNTDFTRVQDFESQDTTDGWYPDEDTNLTLSTDFYLYPEGGEASLDVRGSGEHVQAKIMKMYRGLIVDNEYTVSALFGDAEGYDQRHAKVGVTGIGYGTPLEPGPEGKVVPEYTFVATNTEHEVILEFTTNEGNSGFWDNVTFSGNTTDTYASPGGDNGFAIDSYYESGTGVFRFDMQPGEVYTAVATANIRDVQTNTGSLARQIVAYAGGGSSGVETIIATSLQAPNKPGLHEIRLIFMVPEDSLSSWIRLYDGSTPGDGDVQWSKFLLAEGAYEGSFFDGNTPSTVDAIYSWEGEPGDSPSLKLSWE